ncbi:MAG: glycosyltransferase, partial [Bacteroidetes bacterium]|nr:glycosyltransferase [Bacteroidota bacterium]
RLSYAKGIIEFVSIISELSASLKNVRFLFVGDGVLKNELHEKISGLNLGGIVKTTGHTDNIAKYFSITDLIVLPSFSECFPLVIEESMFFRVPVVCSDVGGIPEIVEDASTGFLFKKGDFAALKSILFKLYADKENLGIIAENAYGLVREKFDLKNNVKGFEQIVEDLID